MAKYKLPKIEELLDAGVHFGHQTRRWSPKMEKYIFSAKKNIHIIDLEKTEVLLKEACEFLYKTASDGGQIIMVGTKKQAREMVKIEAKRSGAHYVAERWLGGTITNFGVIGKNTKLLVDLMRQREAGEFQRYTKKERLILDRKIAKLETSIGGIVSLKKVPDALFVIDARREKTAIREANRAGVPVVALVDTNSDPTGVDYVIPGNDDAIKSVSLILKTVADVIEAGYKEYAEKLEKGELKKDEQPESSDKKEAKEEKPLKVTSAESPSATEKAGKKLVKETKSPKEEKVEKENSEEKKE